MLTTSLFFMTQQVLSQSVFQRKTNWTIEEVKEWPVKQKDYLTWHGWMLYQGSDSSTHHFISRVMDSWAFFYIKRSELVLKEKEYPLSRKSSAPLGYYYVDATKDFTKIKDY